MLALGRGCEEGRRLGPRGKGKGEGKGERGREEEKGKYHKKSIYGTNESKTSAFIKSTFFKKRRKKLSLLASSPRPPHSSFL